MQLDSCGRLKNQPVNTKSTLTYKESQLQHAPKQGCFLHQSHAKWQPITVNLCSQPVWPVRQKTDDVKIGRHMKGWTLCPKETLPQSKTYILHSFHHPYLYFFGFGILLNMDTLSMYWIWVDRRWYAETDWQIMLGLAVDHDSEWIPSIVPTCYSYEQVDCPRRDNWWPSPSKRCGRVCANYCTSSWSRSVGWRLHQVQARALRRRSCARCETSVGVHALLIRTSQLCGQ